MGEMVGQWVQGSGGGGAARSRNASQGGGWGKKPKTELLELGFGRAVEKSGGGRWGEMVGRRVQGSGSDGATRSRNASQEADRSKNPKPSCWSSVWGALLKTSAGEDGGRWWDGPYKGVAVVGRGVRETRGRGAVGATKTRTRAAGARFRVGHQIWRYNAIGGGGRVARTR